MDHHAENASVLERFRKFLGRSPSDVEIERIGRLQEIFELRGTDSIWLLWWALEYYRELYEKFPSRIQDAASKSAESVTAIGNVQVASVERIVLEALKEYKATCEAAKAEFRAMASAEHARMAAEIARSLNKEIPTALKRAARGFEWRNACITAISSAALLLGAWTIGYFAHHSGPSQSSSAYTSPDTGTIDTIRAAPKPSKRSQRQIHREDNRDRATSQLEQEESAAPADAFLH